VNLSYTIAAFATWSQRDDSNAHHGFTRPALCLLSYEGQTFMEPTMGFEPMSTAYQAVILTGLNYEGSGAKGRNRTCVARLRGESSATELPRLKTWSGMRESNPRL
jgi:hypothetical protein